MDNIIKVIDRLLFAKANQAIQYQIIKGKRVDTGHKFPTSISISELLTTELYRQDIRAALLKLEELGYISNIIVLGNRDLPWQRVVLASRNNYRFQLKIDEKKLKFYKNSKIRENADWRFSIVISDNGSIYRSDDRNLIYVIKKSKSGKPERLQITQRLQGKDTIKSYKALGNNAQLLSKEISVINKSFRKKLDLNSNLIIRDKKGGYKLNWDDYEIKFEKF
ncbi:MAG: hypothetical protein WC456_04140 [Patescibacteria group bacterium]